VAKERKPQSARQVVLRITKQLNKAGFQALLAGGCVRDMLLGRQPKDYDIATNATPQDVMNLFRRTISVGAKFGVIVVLIGGRQIEVATFRSDAEYEDGRRPVQVEFTNARCDAQRRDFTVNGMFYDPLTERVIDYVNGQKDITKKIIRAIGNADERFGEDHLRMLRAIRFSCQLNFKIAPTTFRAICKHASKITRVSTERITTELEMILTDPNRARGIQLALDSSLLNVILNSMPPKDLIFGRGVLAQLPRRCSFALALAALLINCKSAAPLCRRLKTSNDLRKQTSWLIEHVPRLLKSPPETPGQLKKWLNQPLFEPLMQLARATLRARGESESPLRQLRNQIRLLGDEPIAPKRLLDGHELIRLGAKPGPMVGQLVEELYLAQLENQLHTKSQAKSWVKQWLNKRKTIKTK